MLAPARPLLRSNQLIHIFCIWPILFSAIVLLADIPLPESVISQIPAAVVEAAPFRMDNVGFVIGAAYFLWHFTLSFSIGAVANCLVIACLIGSDAWHANYPETLPAYAWALHIGCWLAQFYGHGVHEQRRPALLENLFACEPAIRLTVWSTVRSRACIAAACPPPLAACPPSASLLRSRVHGAHLRGDRAPLLRRLHARVPRQAFRCGRARGAPLPRPAQGKVQLSCVMMGGSGSLHRRCGPPRTWELTLSEKAAHCFKAGQ